MNMMAQVLPRLVDPMEPMQSCAYMCTKKDKCSDNVTVYDCFINIRINASALCHQNGYIFVFSFLNPNLFLRRLPIVFNTQNVLHGIQCHAVASSKQNTCLQTEEL